MEIPAQNVIDQKLALSKQAEETLEIIMLEQYCCTDYCMD